MATPTTLPADFNPGEVLTAGQMDALRGAFRILQVVSSSDTTTRSTTTDYPVVSTLNVSITPQSTSSLVFVVASISTASSGGTNTNKINLLGLSVGSGSTTSIYRTRVGGAAISTDFFTNSSMTFLHSPASTSPQIYNVLFGRYGASFDNQVIINGDAGGGATGRSTITAFEISA
jgi:hypothetical protein